MIAGVDLAYWVNNDRQEYAVCCIVIVDKADVDQALETLKASGEDAYVLGETVKADDGVILD